MEDDVEDDDEKGGNDVEKDANADVDIVSKTSPRNGETSRPPHAPTPAPYALWSPYVTDPVTEFAVDSWAKNDDPEATDAAYDLDTEKEAGDADIELSSCGIEEEWW